MSETSVVLATSQQDIAAEQQLCRDFVSWQLDEFPEHRDKILFYFEPVSWERTLAALPRLHARPRGALLLAKHHGAPVGCVMYHEMAPGIAEVKRLFVATAGRGRGVGTALVEAMLSQARADGYREVRLDSARFLTAAIALYRKLGFREIEPPADSPAEIGDVAIFMARELSMR